MAWERRTKTCPPSSCCPTPAAGSKGDLRPTAPASCRRASKARSCGRARGRSSTWRPPQGPSVTVRRRILDLTGRLNARHLAARGEVPELAARIQAYELAYRMQSAAPEAVDLSRETDATKRLYGLDRPETAEFGTRCL